MRYLLAAAVLPALALLYYIRKMDKIEAEPMSMIVRLCVYGALTIISSVFLELIGGAIIGSVFSTDSLPYLILDNFLIVAGAEEGGKHVVLKKGSWKSPEFNYTYDAVVYATAVSLGFAAVENILYVMDGGFGVALMRALTSVPGHTVFGVFMGFYYGLAKKAEMRMDSAGMKRYLRLSLIVPVLLHGFYDFCLSVGNDWFLAVFFVFFILLVIFAFRKVKRLSAEDASVVQIFNPPLN